MKDLDININKHSIWFAVNDWIAKNDLSANILGHGELFAAVAAGWNNQSNPKDLMVSFFIFSLCETLTSVNDRWHEDKYNSLCSYYKQYRNRKIIKLKQNAK